MVGWVKLLRTDIVDAWRGGAAQGWCLGKTRAISRTRFHLCIVIRVDVDRLKLEWGNRISIYISVRLFVKVPAFVPAAYFTPFTGTVLGCEGEVPVIMTVGGEK